ncbi:MAG TPA: gluconate 2-dehydrogenase subunit 3 family protein [Steroidobacteraceae bacterium]|nr:gluconate 2-dehydrogenase subunit 3 family protein [Steroidobacteraceae bacterium]
MSGALSRRQALAGSLAFAFSVGGLESWLTPREARAAQADYRVLDAAEVRTLEAFGETLLPGAREAGIAHFVDQQLAAPPEDCLLMIRYLDIAPPYLDFYRPALAALDAYSLTTQQARFAELTPEAASAVVEVLSRSVPEGWQAAPAPLFFFVARSDAVDVVYGTVEGFAKLGIPYMPHIMPARRW